MVVIDWKIKVIYFSDFQSHLLKFHIAQDLMQVYEHNLEYMSVK